MQAGTAGVPGLPVVVPVRQVLCLWQKANGMRIGTVGDEAHFAGILTPANAGCGRHAVWRPRSGELCGSTEKMSKNHRLRVGARMSGGGAQGALAWFIVGSDK
jgi:hypothetical protein